MPLKWQDRIGAVAGFVMARWKIIVGVILALIILGVIF